MVAGDAVNTAARVQAAAAPGQVWVDETTRLLTSSAITYVDVGQPRAEGQGRPGAAVGGARRGRRGRRRAAGRRPRGAAGRPGPRAAAVQGAVPRRRGRRPPAAAGRRRRAGGRQDPAGVGVREVRRRAHRAPCVAQRPLPRLRRGRRVLRARRGGPRPARAPIVEERRGRDRAGRCSTAGWRGWSPTRHERAWLRPRLGALLGVGSVGALPPRGPVLRVDDVPRAGRRRRTRSCWSSTTPSTPTRGCCSSSSTCSSAGRFACFVVLLTRPGLLEDRPALATNRRATVVHLETLPAADMGDAARRPGRRAARRGARPAGGALRGRPAVRRRDGALADRPRPRRARGAASTSWPTAPPSTSTAVQAPASLQALVAARLDALSPDQRRVVDRASVLGDVVHARGDRRAVPGRGRRRRGAGRAWCGSRSSARRPAGSAPSSGSTSFVQSVVRQVAYAPAVAARPQGAAPRGGGADRSRGSEHDDLAAVVAQHYLDAVDAVPGDPDADSLRGSAVSHLERAAARAAGLGGPNEAAAHLAVALPLRHRPRAARDRWRRRWPGRCTTPAATTRRAGTRSRQSGCWSRPGTGSAPPCAAVTRSRALGLGLPGQRGRRGGGR